jgi:hypothetical protein
MPDWHTGNRSHRFVRDGVGWRKIFAVTQTVQPVRAEPRSAICMYPVPHISSSPRDAD